MSLKDIFALAGMENADLTETEIVATAEEAAEAVVEAEIKTAEADIAEHDKCIAEQETAIEALEEKVEELEEIIDGNESMMSGESPFNAGLFHDRMARGAKIVAKFGVPVEVQGVESYADASTANLAAYAGIESFKETAMKAAGAVKKFFVDLYNSFINLFVGLFNKLKGIKNSAGVTKAKVQKAEKLKEGEVSLPKSASLLSTNGGSDAIAKLVTVGGKVYSELQDLGIAHEGDSAQAVHAVADSLAAVGTKSTEGKTDSSETLVSKFGQGAEVHIVAPTTDAGIDKVKVTVKLGEAPKSSGVTKESLVRLMNEVASAADKLQNAKLDKSALTQQRDRAIGVMEKHAKEAGTDESRDGKEIKKEKKVASGAIKAAHRAGLKLGRAATALGAEILDAQIAFAKAHV